MIYTERFVYFGRFRSFRKEVSRRIKQKIEKARKREKERDGISDLRKR